MSSDRGYTTADLLVTALAREVDDGDLLTQGIGTHLPTCAGFLAKRTHAPSCCFLYSVGGVYSDRIGKITLTGFGKLSLNQPLRRVTYDEIVWDHLPTLPFKEFSRPAQVDRFGNTNNMVIGPYERPKVRLPGAGGIPDFSSYRTHESLLYLPRQESRVLVEKLDFRSGVGRLDGQDEHERRSLGVTGRGSHRLITDLAIIDFRSEGPRVASLHPGVEPDALREATGFHIDVPAEVPRTPEPTAEQLAIINEVDPSGIRQLEFVSASERFDRIRELARAEAEGTR